MAQFPMPLPRYDGRGSFRRFCEDFKSYCVVQSFSDDAALNCLPLCLDGAARDAFATLERPDDGTVSAQLLLDRLGAVFPDASAMDSHGALQALRYDPESQSLDSFIIKLRGLVTAVFGAKTPDSHLFHYFLAALPQRLAHAVVSMGCETFDAAVKQVQNVLAADRLSRGPGQQGQRVNAVGGECTPSEPRQDPGQAGAASGGPGVHKVAGGDNATEPRTEPSTLELILRRIEQLELQVATATRVGQMRREMTRGHVSDRHDLMPKCLCCGESGHTKPECRFRLARCFSCGKVGHVQRTCFSGNAEGEGAQGGARAPRSPGRRREPAF